MTTEVRDLLKARNAAYKSGDVVALRSARANLDRAIREAKHTHGQKIQNFFNDAMNTRRMWQGIQTITGYKAAPPPSDVQRTLKKVNPRKAAGPDSIPGRLLRDCADQLAHVLTDIFNTSIWFRPAEKALLALTAHNWLQGIQHDVPVALGTPNPPPAPAPSPAKEEKPADKENEAKKEDKPQAPAPAPAPAPIAAPAAPAPAAPAPAAPAPAAPAAPAPAAPAPAAPAPAAPAAPAPAAPAPAAPAPAAPAPAPAPTAAPANPDQAGPEGEEVAPPPTPPIVINKYSDEQLRFIAKRMRERLQIYKEKVVDQYASSPEISPPVTPVLLKDNYTKLIEERKRQAEEDRIKKEEADKKKKEEQEKKKKEAEEKKKEEEEKKKKAEAEEKKQEKDIKTKLIEAAWISVDVVLKPFEDQMDSVLGITIDPFTDRRYIAWLSIVTLAFNYNTWFVTVRLCFPYHSESAIPYWFTLDLLADIIYLTDSILFQPRKQFVKGGDIIKDRMVTKNHYRESERFMIDMLCLLPFDLLYFRFGFRSIFRANRLLKADTFFEFSDRLESLMAKAYIWRVIRTIGYLLFMLHLNACFYYVASAYQGIGGTKWVYSGLGSAYLRCYYYAVRSLINIGGLPEPVTVFEITFQLCNFFIGVFVFSSLIGQMRDVIGAATAGQTYFRSSMDGTVAYMVTNHIPLMVQNRVRTWFTYTWDAQGMLDESDLLDSMPLVMRTAIAIDINLTTFQKIDLFKGCDQQMLVDMLLRLKSIVYLPGDFVVKKGDIGKEMYIIKSGAVQVVGGPDNSIVFVTLKAGCVFGEISLLQSSKDGGNRRTANVKAYGFANLFVLEKKDLFDILVHYPESQKVLARKGKKLMKAKGPGAAKAEEEKKKGLALFGPKPPTPKLLRAFGGNLNKTFVQKMKAAAAGQ
ncbi:cyclic nucleotide-gated cation channel beta-3-like [Cottoperca gobio]|uniref:Cyclic nucleotide-gated cation channel beta-3-like n=1 Tax=Cottoperca gobio TaxID=56716 RepID=A0A6J2RT28_COTGO|nr:cyclic nucleotide-gated cation channel beta-3-like [Cottoperca gobio]